MKLLKIETGNFKLDGGALFGVVPKSLWNKVYPADKNNMCTLSMRCLFIEAEKRNILIDTGIGRKQTDKFFNYYFLNGTHSLENSLRTIGVKQEDITDVILTHLHFDHCGGAAGRDIADNDILTFPNAVYWVSHRQWLWAENPNQREKASFLKENFEPIVKKGKLQFIYHEGPFINDMDIRFFNGHTDGMIVPFIRYNNRTLVFMADLIPTSAHIPGSWICGFDIQPLVSLEERKKFLEEAVDNEYILFFEHDLYTECCSLKITEKGIRMDQSFTLNEILSK